MGMLNYLGQKSKLDEMHDDLIRLQNYAKHINICVSDINACWVGNKDKQKLIGALASHVTEVNQATVELNIFKQTAIFVLNIMNELGELLGVKRPNINPIGKTPVSVDSHVNTKIRIDTTALRIVADKIEREKKHLTDTTFSIRGTNNILDVIILNVFGLGGLLKTIDVRVDGLGQENTKIVLSIRKICDLYESTEDNLKKKIEAIGAVVVPAVVPSAIPQPKPGTPPQVDNGKPNGRIQVVVQQWAPQFRPNPDYNPAVWGRFDSISESACGVAAASMALSSVGINKSPIEICEMNEAKGNRGDYMSCWSELGLLDRSIISSDPNFDGDIQECLTFYQDNPDKNSPPIIYIGEASGGPHFVVVLQDVGDHYVIQDPGFPKTRELPKPVSYTQVNQYRG